MCYRSFLVTGDAFNTIGASYRISGTTVGRIVKETCSVLWKILSNSNLGYAINNNLLNLPNERQFERTNKYYPYVFVGDDAFPLKKCLMKPYPRKNLSIQQIITNYRISRARRIVENAFGIATSRFRVFRRAINASVKTATEVTKAVVVLHNFLEESKIVTVPFVILTISEKETGEVNVIKMVYMILDKWDLIIMPVMQKKLEIIFVNISIQIMALFLGKQQW